jgi:AcrR family transcriptional regulator
MGNEGNGQRRTFGPQGERRRAELMQAAVELAADQGFTRTRVSDIVGHVGVGQGVFYWYFESKEALFREILTDTTRRLRFFQGCYLGEEPDPVRRIAKGIVATFDFVVHNAHVFALLDHASVQARFAAQRTEVARVHGVDTARHVIEAMDNRLIRRTDPMYISEAITGVIDRLARVYFASDGRDLDAVIQEAVDFCLGGLLGADTMRVVDLRKEVDDTPELRRLRDQIGASDTEVPSRPR